MFFQSKAPVQPILCSMNETFELMMNDFLVLGSAFGYKLCCVVKELNHSKMVYGRSDNFLHIFKKQYCVHTYIINPNFNPSLFCI